MSSIGESDIVVDSTLMGKVRVRGIHPAPAIYPRMHLQLGVSLQELSQGQGALTGPYELVGLNGELRLSEGGDVCGAVVWQPNGRFPRSASRTYEEQLSCYCDLDPVRLELIERVRGSNAPVFWLELFMHMATGLRQHATTVRPFRLAPPREQWLQFIAKAGGRDFEVLEVQYGATEREFFRRGLERVREAREALREGDYDKSVSICRKVIEAAGHELDSGAGEAAFKSLFVRKAGDRKGGEYGGIVARIKQLAGFAIHDFGAPMVYTRQEAQFVVRVTESLLSLASHFAVAPDRSG